MISRFVATIWNSPPSTHHNRNNELIDGTATPVIATAISSSTSAVGIPYKYRTKPAPLTDSRPRSFCCIAVRQHWNSAAVTAMGIQTGIIDASRPLASGTVRGLSAHGIGEPAPVND